MSHVSIVVLILLYFYLGIAIVILAHIWSCREGAPIRFGLALLWPLALLKFVAREVWLELGRILGR